MSRLQPSVALLGWLAFASCEGEGGSSSVAFSVDTLASGRLIARNIDGPAPSWTLIERTRIGSIDGDGPDVLGQIRDVEIGVAGELYILDAQAGEVRVFSPEGSYVRTIGREGQGPGELNRASGLAFDPDGALWVVSTGNARYSAFNPVDGELLREERRLASFFILPFPGGFDAAGRFLDIGLRLDREPGGEPVLLRLDPDFVPADTLVLPRTDARYEIAFHRDGGMYASVLDPFAPQPRWAPHPDGGMIVGEGDAYRLHRVGFGSDTTLTIELAREPIPVTVSDRDSALARFRELAQELDARPEREPRVPAVKPAHGTMFVDDQARLWVRRITVGGSGTAWDLFDTSGRRVGDVSGAVPAYTAPVVRGDRLAVYAEEDGIPTVYVYDIVPTDDDSG